jgi:hypothetical protein
MTICLLIPRISKGDSCIIIVIPKDSCTIVVYELFFEFELYGSVVSANVISHSDSSKQTFSN